MSYELKNKRIHPGYMDKRDYIRPDAYDNFCLEAEECLFESLNFNPDMFYEVHNISFVLRKAVFIYPQPVKAGEFMDVTSVIKKLGTTSITFHHTFYKKNSREGERFEVATAERVLVCVGRYDRTSTKLPTILVESIRRVRPDLFDTKKT